MRSKLNSSRGQALIIIAFAIMGLVGITGLAVDGGLVFSDRRHAQNAADTASIAGALVMITEQEEGNTVRGDPWAGIDGYYDEVILAAKDLALENGYDSNPISNTVEVYLCDDVARASCGYYQGDPDYVQVIISTNINTFFARVLGITQLHNRVQALALGDDDDSGQLYGGDSIIALSPDCKDPASFLVQGSADITVTGGGLYINSDDPSCGFKCDTNSGTISGEITTAGGEVDMSDHCSTNHVGPEPAMDGDPWNFPVYLEDVGLDVPAECSGTLGTYRNLTTGFDYNDGSSQTYDYYHAEDDYPAVAGEVTVLTPGRYYDFPPKKEQPLGALKDTIYMEPGVYCVENMVKLIDTKLVLLGHNVVIFIRDGYTFDMNGGKIQIDAQDEGPYSNYLIILEPNYDGYPDSWTAPNCAITGNSLNIYEGAIFAPTCNVTINGADSNEDTNPDAVVGFDAQIIAYTVKINGNKDITFTYDNDDNPYIDDPAKTGLMK